MMKIFVILVAWIMIELSMHDDVTLNSINSYTKIISTHK